jgi:superfamily II DNA/RNA helicase
MQLAARVMREPQRIEIDSPQDKHLSIKQTLHWADSLQHKRKLLDHWLRDASIDQVVVFASTQIECDGLANDLVQDGFHAVALHGALSQGLRNRRLAAFREGRVQILVATDVAARGLDVPTITHVINFGLPMKAEDYVHRIGRTGRAGRSGEAITLAEFRDRRRISDIEFFTKQPFKPAVIAGLEPQQRFPSSFEQRPRGSGGRPPGRGAGFRSGSGGGQGSGQGSGWGSDRGFADRAPRRADPRQGDPRRDDRQFAGRAPVPGAAHRDRAFDPRFEGRREGFAPRPDFARPAGGAVRAPARKPSRPAR